MKWKFNAYLLQPLGKSVKINKCRAFVYSEHKKMYRGKINGKAGKAAALPKFSDTLTLSQWDGDFLWTVNSRRHFFFKMSEF